MKQITETLNKTTSTRSARPKCNSNINETNNNPSLKENIQQPTHSKQAEMASNINGHQQHDQLQRANHENIKKRWRTIENTTRYQSEPIGYVINVSKKTFTKAKFQLLNKILISYPHLKCIININSMKN